MMPVEPEPTKNGQTAGCTNDPISSAGRQQLKVGKNKEPADLPYANEGIEDKYSS
jgi:hypothetical protein